ncbi:MAG: tRNA dihydrouridine(20/20a) synthase DusA [Gammaproteobacteria bacterium]|nr:tRNA dihydrouridine(20/20a) synthase DusA [Gammaproteobacteria bacterium]
MINRRFSIAPMLDWTDRHERYFLRLISRHALLYTEMVHTNAILRGDRQRFLEFNPAEHPLALQLGGSEPADLAECARIAEGYGYDEVNLNVGCPSERVKSGQFGACLMATPQRVADCVSAMQAAVSIPVTVKHRTGIDELDSWAHLSGFVETVADAGCGVFIVHARKAWLKGLSPKENREVPPLHYDVVYRLKQAYPQLEIIINGGLTSLDTAIAQLEHVDGVMMGREAYHNPYILAEVDRLFYDDKAEIVTREAVLQGLMSYIAAELDKGTKLHAITRHIMGLYQAVPGARAWRRHLSEQGVKQAAGLETLVEAAKFIGVDI